MDSLKSFVQLVANTEERLKTAGSDEEKMDLFDTFLNAGIDQLEIACQMQISSNDRDILVLTVIENLMKLPNQPSGFTDKVLENLVSVLSDSISTDNLSDTGASIEPMHVLAVTRCAKHLCASKDLPTHTLEPFYRRSVLGLIDPSKVFESYLQLIEAGEVRNACLVCVYFPVQCRFESIKEAYETYESVPQNVSAADLQHWLVSDLVPFLFAAPDGHSIMSTSGDGGNVDILEQGKLPVVLKICRNLVDWAREYEEADQNPQQALVVADCAAHIATLALGLNSVAPRWDAMNTSFAKTHDNMGPTFEYLMMKDLSCGQKVSSAAIDTILQSIFSIQLNLQLQREIWFRWSHKLRLGDIERMGIRSIVYKRLWIVSSEAVPLELVETIAPVLQLCRLSVDSVLDGWIADALQTKVISCRPADKSMTYDESSAEGDFNKLVLVAKLITNPHRRAQAILSLLQVPVVMSQGSDDDDDDSDDGSVDIDELRREQQKELVAAHQLCINSLCDAATAVSPLVDSKTKDLLVESLRLQRIKTLAFQYGVDAFDPRDYRQVRAVAGLIVSHVESPSSIPDALEIVQAWSAGGFDVTGFLSRALVHRATYSPAESSEESSHLRKRLLASALKLIPANKLKVVVESTVDCLIGMVEEICDCNDEDDDDDEASCAEKRLGVVLDPSDKDQYYMCCESAFYILTWYLDEKKGLSDSAQEFTVSAPSSSSAGSLLASADSGDRASTLVEGSTGVFTVSGDQSDAFSKLNHGTVAALKRIRQIQREFDLYLPLSCIGDAEACREVVGQIADKHVLQVLDILPKPCSAAQAAAVVEGEVLVTLRHRRICAALHVSQIFFVHRVVKCLFKNNQKEVAMQLANSLGVDKKTSSNETSVRTIAHDEDARLLVDTAVTLSAMAARQVFAESGARTGSRSQNNSSVAADSARLLTKSFELSRSLLQSTALSCSSLLLNQVVDLLQGADIALSIFSRIEGEFSQSNTSCYATHGEGTFDILEHNFARDGILMNGAKVLGPLMKFCMKEMKRRSSPITNGLAVTDSVSATSASRTVSRAKVGKSSTTGASTITTSSAMTGPAFTAPAAVDLEDLVTVLQKSENHLLAARVLLGSWHISKSKSEAIRQSTVSLCRKILTYRGIDTGLAVASLGMLPFELMVKEVKASVPSIQSDFSRLRTVALVGEELARMWDQETLLIVFQSLQMNARWWHTLSSHGIKIDARAFQSADAVLRENYMKSVVPDLLTHTNLNLPLAYEYCQQFNLEPEVATLCYIESILLLPPQASSSWKNALQLASVGVNEKLLISRFRKILVKIHPLDYEKILYSCHWLANALNDDQEKDNLVQSKEKTRALSSETGPLAEFKNYLTYSETVGFLSAQHFPSDLLTSIPQIRSYYDGVPETYKSRLPFWTLLEEPWTVIEPLMAADPDAASKLSPLCAFLHIDRDEFYSRAIMSSYTHASEAGLSQVAISTDSVMEPDQVDLKAVEASKQALESVRISIDLVASRFRQIEVWRWVYERELHSNINTAVVALNEAVSLLELHSRDLKSSTADDKEDELMEVNCMLSELQLERAKINCRLCLEFLEKRFAVKDSHLFDSHKITALIANPTVMIQKVFEDAVECCWSHQLHSIRAHTPVFTVRDVMNQPLAPSVATLLDALSDKIAELCDICKVLKSNVIRSSVITTDAENLPSNLGKKPHGDDNTNKKVDAEWISDTDMESGIRSAIVTKLLADVDPLVESSSASSTTAKNGAGSLTDHRGASSITSFESATSIKNKKAHGAFSASLWGRNDTSTLSVTESELRRRDDLYLAFSVAVVVGSSRDAESRATHAQRLDAVMTGNNARAMRRLTARSKLRAAQALLFMRKLSFKTSTLPTATLVQVIDSSMQDLLCRHTFLFCFAELQETRLLCSEESLGDALGIKITSASTGAKVQVVGGDPRPLVRTWVHDEGSLSEAMELSRDVLLAARVADTGIWKALLTTLLHHGHGRPLLQTLLTLISTNQLSAILHDDVDLRYQLTASVAQYVEESVDKLAQIWDVVRLKVQSSMAESAAAHAKQTVPSGYNKGDPNRSVNMSKQELQKMLCSTSAADHDHDKEKDKGVGPTTADINHALSGHGGLPKARRTLLVERCQASILGWEEPPEELLLSLQQAAELWKYFSNGTMYTASKEYQSRVGTACQKLLSLLCQTFALSSSVPVSVSCDVSAASSKTVSVRRLTVDEALRQSGLQCMLALIRSSCSGLTDLRKVQHSSSGSGSAIAAGSVKVVTAFLESLILTVVKHSAGLGHGTSGFADYCLWNLLTTCVTCVPKPVAVHVVSNVMERLSDDSEDLLARLLSLASMEWTCSEDSRRTTAIVLSWCLTPDAASASEAPVDSESDEIDEVQGGSDSEKVSCVRAAIASLCKEVRSRLRVIMDTMSTSFGPTELLTSRSLFENSF